MTLPQEPPFDSQGSVAVAIRYGLPALVGSLPLEIVRSIHALPPSETFWRLPSAQDLAARFDADDPGNVDSIELSYMEAWERGGTIDLEADLGSRPIIRMTIDTHGLRRIERLPGRGILRSQGQVRHRGLRYRG